MQQVFSVDEWKKLPELRFRAIKDTDASGSTYLVHKVGFLAVSDADCIAANIRAPIGPAGKAMLPTILVQFSDEKTLCRLPIALRDWALNCVAMAHAKQLQFPCEVEFGTVNGRQYAEFLI